LAEAAAACRKAIELAHRQKNEVLAVVLREYLRGYEGGEPQSQRP
jgi:hypothetical protein